MENLKDLEEIKTKAERYNAAYMLALEKEQSEDKGPLYIGEEALSDRGGRLTAR